MGHMVFIITSALLALASGHMMLKEPLAFRSEFDQELAGERYNQAYDYTRGPLAMDGSNYPCKGYQKDSWRKATTDYKPGFSYTAVLQGNTPHRGGSCQLSLSYDEGETFYVIKSVVGGCTCVDGISCPNDYSSPQEVSIPFTIPADAPAKENILFAWSWINVEGNREYYMNCAAVNILGDNKSGLAGLPELYVTNLQPSCQVPYGQSVVYPNPGSDVLYQGPYAGTVPDSTPVNGCPDYSASLPAVVVGDGEPVTSSTRSSTTSTRSSTRSSTTSTTSAAATAGTCTEGESICETADKLRRCENGSFKIHYAPEGTTCGNGEFVDSSSEPSSCTANTCSSSSQRVRCDNGVAVTESAPEGFVCSQGIWTLQGDIDGTCSSGTKCGSGNSFYQCSNGFWVDFGELPSGASCENDLIVAA